MRWLALHVAPRRPCPGRPEPRRREILTGETGWFTARSLKQGYERPLRDRERMPG
jgi:hypothetical protein